MQRLNSIDPATATGEAKELLDGVQKKLGATPNVIRTLANSPAALKAYLGTSEALSNRAFRRQEPRSHRARRRRRQ